MKVLRKIIEIDDELCDGCGQCVPSCAEGSLEIIDGKARVVADNLCDGLGACLGECPTGALSIVEREADEFDEEAVEEFLESKAKEATPPPEAGLMPCGCPSTQIQSFAPATSCQQANQPAAISGGDSALSHWPIQIRLVPAKAPFLKGADLLVLADCCGVSYSTLHNDFLKGKTVMMGCPKFDDVQSYIDKFAEVFNVAQIKSVTCMVMEVPCCSGLPIIVQRGMEKSDVKLPIQEVVISTRGKLMG